MKANQIGLSSDQTQDSAALASLPRAAHKRAGHARGPRVPGRGLPAWTRPSPSPTESLMLPESLSFVLCPIFLLYNLLGKCLFSESTFSGHPRPVSSPRPGTWPGARWGVVRRTEPTLPAERCFFTETLPGSPLRMRAWSPRARVPSPRRESSEPHAAAVSAPARACARPSETAAPGPAGGRLRIATAATPRASSLNHRFGTTFRSSLDAFCSF